jgi:hypothetical protein
MGGGKGNGGMGGGGDVRQVPGPWRMPTSWGGSPSSGLPGSFPAGPRMSAGGGFAGMGGYPGNSPWGGGPPMGPGMSVGDPVGQLGAPPPMSHGDPIPTNQVATTDMGMPSGVGLAAPWLRGGPVGNGMPGMSVGDPVGQLGAPPPMSHGDPIPTNQVATTDMGMPGGEARGGLHYAMPMATGGPTPWGGGGMNYARPMPWRGGMF